MISSVLGLAGAEREELASMIPASGDPLGSETLQSYLITRKIKPLRKPHACIQEVVPSSPKIAVKKSGVKCGVVGKSVMMLG